jgi:SAM-dependent methyltransferase
MMQVRYDTRRVKLPRKTRLARYGIDTFLLDVAKNMPAGILLLDGGAGNCKHLNFFPHVRTIALDLEPCRRRRYGEIDLAATLYAIPIRNNTVDAVINVEVIEHLAEPVQALSEIFRILRPGGRLYLIAPQGWEVHDIPNDYFRFTRYGLQYLFEKVGLRVLSIAPLGGYFWYLGHRVAVAYRYLFPSDRKLLWKFFDAPFRHPARLILRTLVPYLCFYLDKLDTRKSYTLNYGCVCEKPVDWITPLVESSGQL